jgi:hypothetical protein
MKEIKLGIIGYTPDAIQNYALNFIKHQNVEILGVYDDTPYAENAVEIINATLGLNIKGYDRVEYLLNDCNTFLFCNNQEDYNFSILDNQKKELEGKDIFFAHSFLAAQQEKKMFSYVNEGWTSATLLSNAFSYNPYYIRVKDYLKGVPLAGDQFIYCTVNLPISYRLQKGWRKLLTQEIFNRVDTFLNTDYYQSQEVLWSSERGNSTWNRVYCFVKTKEFKMLIRFIFTNTDKVTENIEISSRKEDNADHDFGWSSPIDYDIAYARDANNFIGVLNTGIDYRYNYGDIRVVEGRIRF